MELEVPPSQQESGFPHSPVNPHGTIPPSIGLSGAFTQQKRQPPAYPKAEYSVSRKSGRVARPSAIRGIAPLRDPALLPYVYCELRL